MSTPHVLVLRSAGVNCELETARAWELAGAVVRILHVNELRDRPALLQEAQVLKIRGGFSFGDDISGGKILAGQLQAYVGDALRAFASQDRLILGICNGFQVLCKSGLLPGETGGEPLPPVTVATNLSGKFEDRWVHLARTSDQCVFLKRLDRYEMPVAHGEGRVTAKTSDEMAQLVRRGFVALCYRSSNGGPVAYPENPNGSMLDVAGICDETGRVFGLMPHPERFVDRTHHPAWTSRDIETPDGRAIFESAVEYFE